MSKTFAFQLGLKTKKIYIRAQKSDDINLKTYKMIISTLLMLDKNNKNMLLEKRFLFVDVKLDMIFSILFYILNNTDINF